MQIQSLRGWLAVCLLALPLAYPLQAWAATPPPAEFSAGGAAFRTVIVTLRQQADLRRLDAADPATQQRLVLEALQAASRDGAEQVAAGLALSPAAATEIAQITPFWIFNGFSITAAPAVIDQLAAAPEVLRITPDGIALAPAGLPEESAAPAAIADAAGAAVEPNLALVQAPALWNLGRRGQGIVIASLDTGVDVSHPDLSAAWRGGTNSWYDPYGQHPLAPIDLNGHGTGVMGVLVGGSSGGTAIGAAPGAQWIAARVFNDAGTSTATAAHLAFQWLLDPDGDPNTDDAPDVVNNSWTFVAPGCNLEFELDMQALRAAGILPIFAAGNNGPVGGLALSPGNNPSAFAVGATDSADLIYSGSSRGPSPCDNTVYPEISAPGVDIRSSELGGGFSARTGTSFAAPHAAGVLADLLSAFPNLTAAQQQAALLAGARDLGAGGPDNAFGYGRLDALAGYTWLTTHGFTPQNGSPITVTTTADTLADDGLCSLREAVIAANSDSAGGGCPPGSGDDMITFAAALGRPVTFTLSRSGADEDAATTGDLDVTSNLAIEGGGAASSIIIDGGGSDRVFHVFPGGRLALGAVSLRNGSAAANEGGAVRTAGQLSLRDAGVYDCAGGGIANDGGAVWLFNTTISGHHGGYALSNRSLGALVMEGGSISDNQGGGLLNATATASLTGVTVARNAGGGVRSEGPNLTRLTVDRSTIISNTATSGAGVFSQGVGATTVISGTRISGNTATGAGGGVFNNGSMTIDHSTLDGNTAPSGGGIHHFGGNLLLINSTVSANAAGDNGGGLYNRGSGTLKFVTLAANAAGGPATGGNLFNDEGQLTVAASALSAAAGSENCAVSNAVITSGGYNIAGDASCALAATGDVSADPQLGPLADNGGPSLTHALAASSPARDHIPTGAAGCDAQIAADQRGVSRPQAAGCDSGAYEAAAGADLSVLLSASSTSVAAGERLTYTVAVRNAGPDDAAALTLTSLLLPPTVPLTATLPGGSCTAGQTTVCTLATLAAGAEITATLALTAPPSSPVLTATAEIAAQSLDLVAANNSSFVTVTVRPPGPPLTPIAAIQGVGHRSPLAGQRVATEGIVTALRSDGFYLQDAGGDGGDGDAATSQALFVRTAQPPGVLVGDRLRVDGEVAEMQPSESAGELTVTQIHTPTVTLIAAGQTLPLPVIIGSGGRAAPSTVIEDDGFTVFDPQSDGLDFYESLEAMRVQVNDALVVGPTDAQGGLWVLPDGGAGAGPRSARGGILLTAADANPERIQLGGALYPAAGGLPKLDAGARITTPVVGLLDYRQGNYELLVTAPLGVDGSGQAAPETAAPPGSGAQLTAAVYAAGALSGDADAAAFARRAEQIAANLRGPDLLVLQGVEDDSGAADDGVTTAALTFARLIDAVQAAGGPAYAVLQIDPLNNQDGEPGRNARLGVLYNPARLAVDVHGGDALSVTAVTCQSGAAALTLNPGRIDPANAIWSGGSKPLAVQASFNGHSIFVVAGELAAQPADDPLFGAVQPPQQPAAALRRQQAQALAAFVQQIFACEPEANVLLLGSLEAAPGAAALDPLTAAGLRNLYDLLPADERYSRVREGNSLALDHIYAGGSLVAAAPLLDVVHINAEWSEPVSDRDGLLARFTLPAAPPGANLFLPLVQR